jgi:IclR family acetate operon transcriptional repressor
LTILDLVASSCKPFSLSDLSELLGIRRSSAFRLANTLKRRGFLTAFEGQTEFLLGPSFWRLANHYDWNKMLARMGRENLQTLARQIGETAHLAVPKGRQALFIDHVMGNCPVSMSGQTGELVPLHRTAHGKALLLGLDHRGIGILYGTGPLKAFTRQTISTVEKLEKAGREMRASGLATDDEEYRYGIRCVAAPIRDKDGTVIASIGVSAPLTRFSPERYAKSAHAVMKAAQNIHRLLDMKPIKDELV